MYHLFLSQAHCRGLCVSVVYLCLLLVWSPQSTTISVVRPSHPHSHARSHTHTHAHRRRKEEREGVGKDRRETGGRGRREEWWWVTEWERMRRRGRKEKACGGGRGAGGGPIGRNGVGGGVGGEAGRKKGRSYECWPLSLYINLHINCIKWGSPCFLIFSSLAIPFFFYSPTQRKDR